MNVTEANKMATTTAETNLSPRLRTMRNRTIHAQQEVSIVRARAMTEAIKAHHDQPRSIQLAYGLKETLRQLPITIAVDEQIVGALTEKLKGAVLYPEIKSDFLVNELDDFGQRERDTYVISDKEKQELRESILPHWDKNSAFDNMLSRQSKEMLALMEDIIAIPNNDFSGGNHLGHINYSRVLEHGFEGILAQARTSLEGLEESDPDSEEKHSFYRSVILSAEAVIDFAGRYSALALRLAEKATSNEQKQELLEIAGITSRVPKEPARTFREAVQSFWFTFLGLMNLDGAMEIPLGRLDQTLYPYYKRDLADGRLSRSNALELISELFIKLNQMPHLKESVVTLSHDGGFPRTVTLGGIDENGNDAVNHLSLLILEAADNLRLTHPNIAVRLHPKCPETFKKRVFQIMTNGANILHVFNDEVYIQGFTGMGIPVEAARDYIITGCVQPISRSTYGSTCSAYINGPKILELVLNGGKPIVSLSGETEDRPVPQFGSYEEFLGAFKSQSKSVLEVVIDGMHSAHEVQHRLLPNPILSALTDGTLESGKDVKAGGARYNVTGISLIGLGTIIDSLAAIKEVVFENKTHSLGEVIKWIKAGFQNYEAERQRLLNRAPKYGTDDSQTDKIAQEIVDWFVEILGKQRTYKGGSYTLGLHSENLHVLLGQLTSATPDGRLQGEPLSPGCGPTSGMDKKGPTASLRSVAALDYTKVMGGASANMRFSPTLFKTENGIKLFGAMLKAYFALGGPHLQINSVDAETLRDAQQYPDKNRDLIVRITGYSARFVELSSATQDEIVKRTEMNV